LTNIQKNKKKLWRIVKAICPNVQLMDHSVRGEHRHKPPVSCRNGRTIWCLPI